MLSAFKSRYGVLRDWELRYFVEDQSRYLDKFAQVGVGVVVTDRQTDKARSLH